MNLEALTPEELHLLNALINEIERKEREQPILDLLFAHADTTLIEGVFPYDHKLMEAARNTDGILHGRASYPKHVEFMQRGSTYRKRYMMAGNRIGKTLTGAFEVTCHLTGLYPDWWQGRRFTTCNDWWVVADTTETVTQNLQTLLLGRVGEFGTGLIPKDCIDFETLKDAKKATTGVGQVRVRHVNGTYSTLTFKAYSQGREKFQSAAVSVWMDEEPPLDIYTECVARTLTGDNIIICTFTPLRGISPLIELLFPDGNVFAEGDLDEGRWLSRVAMDDVKHLSEEKIQQLLTEFPTWQRTARRMGLPVLEEGAIFPYNDEDITCKPFEIPAHWPRAFGMDVGNRTAAVWVAHDVETNIYYAYSEHFGKDTPVPMHASAIKARGEWMTGAMDTAGNATSPTDLEVLRDLYVKEGLHLVNANKSVTGGIYHMQTLFQAGRLKIFNTCTGLLQERASYRMEEDKKTGKVKIVKVGDDRIDALRYALMTPGIMKTEAQATAANTITFNYVPAPLTTDGWAL